jgi:hypothetical protein
MLKEPEEKNISVWLEPSKVKNIFRCCRCGKIAFEYHGDVKSIIIGENEVKSPLVVQCKGTIEKMDIFGGKFSQRCHTKYIIS